MYLANWISCPASTSGEKSSENGPTPFWVTIHACFGCVRRVVANTILTVLVRSSFDCRVAAEESAPSLQNLVHVQAERKQQSELRPMFCNFYATKLLKCVHAIGSLQVYKYSWALWVKLYVKRARATCKQHNTYSRQRICIWLLKEIIIIIIIIMR